MDSAIQRLRRNRFLASAAIGSLSVVLAASLISSAQASPPAANSSSAASRASILRDLPVGPLADGEDEKKVLCQYIVFAAPRFVCGRPPLEDVKKRCDERATEERGEPSECSCTEDQTYIQDVCD